MPITHKIIDLIPKVWDAGILRINEDNLTMKQICKAPLAAKAKGYGDTIKFSGLAEPTIGHDSDSFTYEDLEAAGMELKIDHEALYSFRVKDADTLMANADAKGSQLQRTAYQLQHDIESTVFKAVGDAIGADNIITDAACDPESVIGDISEAAVILEENNVRNSKFLVIPPWLKSYLTLSGIKFSINEGINGQGAMSYAKGLDFDIYVSNNLYKPAGTQTYCLAGAYAATGYIDIQYAARTIDLEGKRYTGFDGGFAFGYKVIRPKELVLLDLTQVPYAGL